MRTFWGKPGKSPTERGAPMPWGDPDGPFYGFMSRKDNGIFCCCVECHIANIKED